MSFLFAAAAAFAQQQPSSVVFTHDTFNVSLISNLTYGQGLACRGSNQYNSSLCHPVNLLLDVSLPAARDVPVPLLKPALIFAHGGGNDAGSKEELCLQASAAFFAARGFVAFNIDYRLAGDHGLLPPKNASPANDWTPTWQSGYPATRDLKAAVRFVRAQAALFGVGGRDAALGAQARAKPLGAVRARQARDGEEQHARRRRRGRCWHRRRRRIHIQIRRRRRIHIQISGCCRHSRYLLVLVLFLSLVGRTCMGARTARLFALF